MKKLSLIAFLLFSNVLVAEEDSPMDLEMKKVSKALKSLRKIPLDDWKKQADAARAAHVALHKSMAFVPRVVKGLPDPKQKKLALADCRKMLGECYTLLCELEIAYLKEDGEKAKKILKELKSLKSIGHKEYSDD